MSQVPPRVVHRRLLETRAAAAATAPPRRRAAAPPPAAARPPTRGPAPVIRYEGDEFPDPPDPRYPGVWDYAARSAAKADLGSLLRGGPAASPFGSSPLDTPADA